MICDFKNKFFKENVQKKSHESKNKLFRKFSLLA